MLFSKFCSLMKIKFLLQMGVIFLRTGSEAEVQELDFLDRLSKDLMRDFKHRVLISENYVKICRYSNKIIKIMNKSV